MSNFVSPFLLQPQKLCTEWMNTKKWIYESWCEVLVVDRLQLRVSTITAEQLWRTPQQLELPIKQHAHKLTKGSGGILPRRRCRTWSEGSEMPWKQVKEPQYTGKRVGGRHFNGKQRVGAASVLFMAREQFARLQAEKRWIITNSSFFALVQL